MLKTQLFLNNTTWVNQHTYKRLYVMCLGHKMSKLLIKKLIV